MTIHPTAEVDATAHIADGCEIGPFAVVGHAVILDQIVFFVHTRSWGQTPCLATGARCILLPWSVAIPRTSSGKVNRSA